MPKLCLGPVISLFGSVSASSSKLWGRSEKEYGAEDQTYYRERPVLAPPPAKQQNPSAQTILLCPLCRRQPPFGDEEYHRFLIGRTRPEGAGRDLIRECVQIALRDYSKGFRVAQGLRDRGYYQVDKIFLDSRLTLIKGAKTAT